MGEGVVISAETNGVETNYTYGLERISAQTGKTRTEYIYDGRGSVAAEVSYNNAWYTLGGMLSSKDVISKSYTPFGEQIGEASSGFGYNGEYYSAATGMVYLRARFYEPEMNRFSQKDVVRGSIIQPGSLNRYSYVQNDPVNFIDPSGQSLKSVWNSVKSAAKNAVTSVKNTVSKVTTAVKNTATKVVNTVKNAYNTVSNAAKSAYNQVKTAVSNVFNGGGNSGGSYSGAASGGYAGSPSGSSYTAVPLSNAYTSSGNATSYYNSNRQTGKTPSPDAPRVEDVSGEAAYYCSQKPSDNTELPWYKRAVNQADAIFSKVKSWITSEQGQKTLMIAGSVIEIGAGIALTATGVGGPLGSMLLSAGASSLIGGYSNEINGGSFFAGWAGGEIGGLVTGGALTAAGSIAAKMATDVGHTAGNITGRIIGSYLLTGTGGFAGGFLSDLMTQSIDNESININQSINAGKVSGLVTMVFGWPLNVVGSTLNSLHEPATNIAAATISSINEVITDVSVSIFNQVA